MWQWVILGLAAASAWASEPFVIDRDWSAHYGSYRAPRHVVSDESLGLSALEKVPATSVETFLAWLKNTDPGYLRSFTLMAHSQSAQMSVVDPLHPRIILHKDRLFLGIGGHPGTTGKTRELFQSIEAIEYDVKHDQWRFARIHFTPTLKVDRDDTTCRKCHGERPRPLWPAYDLWPGAYGGAGGREKLATSPGELKNYFEFRGRIATEPGYERYRYLEMPELGPEDWGYPIKGLPNHHLSVHLGYLNYKRIHRELSERPDWPRLKWKILAAFAKCPLPVPQELVRDTYRNLEEEYQRRVILHNVLNGVNTTPQDFEGNRANAELVATLRHLVGESVKDWSLSYEPGSYSYQFGVSDSNMFTIYMYVRDILLREESELAKAVEGVNLRTTPIALWSFPGREALCSRAALGDR